MLNSVADFVRFYKILNGGRKLREALEKAYRAKSNANNRKYLWETADRYDISYFNSIKSVSPTEAPSSKWDNRRKKVA